MRLSLPFFQKKEESNQYFLALLLTSEKTSIIVLEESEGKLKIVSKQNQLFANTIEDLPVEDLIDSLDEALGKAIEVLPANAEVKKTVFGIKESWIEKDSKKIKKNYLQKLKKVCDALELSPIGFIDLTEAISNQLQKEEGAPLSAVLVELGKKIVTLTLVRGGKTVQVVTGAMEIDPTSTVDNLLKQFTIEVLPARIILFDSEISKNLVQHFTGHHWSKSLPFLHMPQISVLPPGFEGQAVTAGAAGQMNLQVLEDEVQSIINYESKNAVKDDEKTPVHSEHIITETSKEKTDTLIPEENFGFVTGHDIAEMKQNHHHYKQADIIDKPNIQTDSTINKNAPEPAGEDIEEDLDEEETEDEEGVEVVEKGKFFEKISMPKLAFPSINSFLLKGIIVPVFLLGILAGGIYYLYVNKVKASIIVTLTPKTENQSIDVVFTAESENDFQNNIIAAKQIDGSLSGDMTIGASGKKDVGDKAHGEVTIYNNNIDSDASLSPGTTIKSSNGLEFTLDKDIKVASAAGDVFSGTKPGTANVKVTASDIGTNFNLPSDTKFTVAGNSALAAKNDNAFSGGTKKSITIVSNDDLVKLKTELIKNLENKVKDELLKQSQSDDSILPVVLSTNIEKSKYDKDAGDEGKTVKLTATIKFTGLSYQNTDEKKFAKAIFDKKYANNMTYDENNIEIQLKDPKKENDNEISATLDLNASLLPKIETQVLSKKLSGKPAREANTLISQLPQVKNMTVAYNPNIYFLAKLFPNLPNNVTVTLSSD